MNIGNYHAAMRVSDATDLKTKAGLRSDDI